MTDQEQYDMRKKAWDDLMEACRPDPACYPVQDDFDKAYRDWLMRAMCDGPNPPGYYRANND